jgi:hypothetical protein
MGSAPKPPLPTVAGFSTQDSTFTRMTLEMEGAGGVDSATDWSLTAGVVAAYFYNTPSAAHAAASCLRVSQGGWDHVEHIPSELAEEECTYIRTYCTVYMHIFIDEHVCRNCKGCIPFPVNRLGQRNFRFLVAMYRSVASFSLMTKNGSLSFPIYCWKFGRRRQTEGR